MGCGIRGCAMAVEGPGSQVSYRKSAQRATNSRREYLGVVLFGYKGLDIEA